MADIYLGIMMNCFFKFTYRYNGLIGLLYFVVIGPVYAQSNASGEDPLLEVAQFELLATDAGKLNLTIKAYEMRQYENGNVTLAGGIAIVLLGDKGNKKEGPTHIQADTLSYNKEQGLCMIAGNVQVSKPQQRLSIHTEQLWYDIKQEILFTELPIVIADKENVLKGGGLRATRDLTKYTVTVPNGTVEIK